MKQSREIGWNINDILYQYISKQLDTLIYIGGQVQLGVVVNPFTSQIIGWLNYLTDTTDTSYDGITPTNEEIEAAVDLINGEII